MYTPFDTQNIPIIIIMLHLHSMLAQVTWVIVILSQFLFGAIALIARSEYQVLLICLNFGLLSLDEYPSYHRQYSEYIGSELIL